MVLNQDNAENRQFIEDCYRTTSTLINPIIDWTNEEVWEYLHHYGCEGNPLYQCDYKRIGCIGCPLSGFNGMKKDFSIYPKYRAAYVRAFDRMIKRREQSGKVNFETWYSGESVMRWWIGDNPLQITIEDWLKCREEEAETMKEYIWEQR